MTIKQSKEAAVSVLLSFIRSTQDEVMLPFYKDRVEVTHTHTHSLMDARVFAILWTVSLAFITKSGKKKKNESESLDVTLQRVPGYSNGKKREKMRESKMV